MYGLRLYSSFCCVVVLNIHELQKWRHKIAINKYRMLCAVEGDFRSGTILRDYQTSARNHSKTIRNSCGHAARRL